METYSYPKTIKFIADILSFEITNTELEVRLSHQSFDWDAIVMEGSMHLVLPAIYCRLKARQLLHVLPEELEIYLCDLTTINRNRNKAILEQVHTISKLLNEHNIEHVFLKGTALLALGCYSDNGERMIGDIDILVEHSQVNRAFKLITSIGYDKTFGFAYETEDFRHLDRLIANDELAAVELHTELLNKNYRSLIDIPSVLKSSRISNSVRIPNNYMLSKHLVLGWQLNDKGHYYNIPNLKTLYDLVKLESHKDNIFVSSVLKLKYGQSYFELAKLYFKEFSIIPSNNYMTYIGMSHQIVTCFSPLKGIIINLKRLLTFIGIRLHLIVFNSNYTKHLIKKIFLSKKH